jgi:hypothetical protein
MRSLRRLLGPITDLPIGLVGALKLIQRLHGGVDVDALKQRFEVNLELLVIENIDWGKVRNPRCMKTRESSHSVLSYVTSSTALPTLLNLSNGSFSRLLRQRRVRSSIDSTARRPTSVLTFLISNNHCFMEAVTASLI